MNATRPDRAVAASARCALLLLVPHSAAAAFSDPVLLTEPSPTVVHAVDVDDDCDLDVVVGLVNGELAWWENDGTGALVERHLIDDDGSAPVAIHSVDLQRDGSAGLLVARGNSLYYHRPIYDGPGFDPASARSAQGQSLRAVATGSLRGSPNLDVVAAAFGDDRIVWWSNGETPMSPLAEGMDGPKAVRIGDLDGDGDLDVAFVSQLDDGIAWVPNRLDEASMDFGPPQPVAVGHGQDAPRALALADLDGDLDLDVAVAAQNDTIAWYENRLGEASVDFAPGRTITTEADSPRTLVAAHVDGDSDVDLVGSSYADQSVAWYDNDGAGNFVRRPLPGMLAGPEAIDVADLDGDGLPEVIAAGTDAHRVAVYRNLGAGREATLYGIVRRPDPDRAVVAAIDAQTAAVTVLYDDGGGYLQNPSDVVVGPDGVAYVANPNEILRIDPDSGEQEVVASGGGIYFPKLAFDRSGNLIATQPEYPSSLDVFRIDLSTGLQTPIRSLQDVVSSAGAAVTADFDILIAAGRGAETVELLRMNPSNGNTSVLASLPEAGAVSHTDVAIADDGAVFVLVASRDATGVYRFDAAAGLVPVSLGDRLTSPRDLAIGDGELFVNDSGADSILRIDVDSGAQSVVSVGPFVFAQGLALRAGELLTVDIAPSRVLALDPATGAIREASTGRSLHVQDVALDSSGLLWITDVNAVLGIDTASGLLEHAIAFPPGTSIGSLLVEESGTLLASSDDWLYRIEPTSGRIAFLGDVVFGPYTIRALAEHDGFLAAVASLGGGAIHRVRLPSATSTLLAEGDFRDIAFLETGELIAASDDIPYGHFRVDRSTGALAPLLIDGIRRSSPAAIASASGSDFWTGVRLGGMSFLQEVRGTSSLVRTVCVEGLAPSSGLAVAAPEPGRAATVIAALSALFALRRWRNARPSAAMQPTRRFPG